ncbi:MAG: phosphatase PAP2 family protein [Armatimonadetes bacterium]|nr:phosphatase PAP2 family protein [Armatimonadota bacterium]
MFSATIPPGILLSGGLLQHNSLAWSIGTHIFPLLGLLTVLTGAAVWAGVRLFRASQERLWQLAGTVWTRLGTSPPARWLERHYPRTWSFLGQRLSPTEYLGLHLTVGVLVTAMMVLLFGGLADALEEDPDLVSFDQTLSEAINSQISRPVYWTLIGLTALGGLEANLALGLTVGILLALRGHRLLLISWTAALLGGNLFNVLLKGLFERPRPVVSQVLLSEPQFSFPSGHAMGSLVLYGMLAYIAIRWASKPASRLLIPVAVALVLAIGLTRIFLGVHYFTDVIAGQIAGTAWLAVVITGTEVARRHRRWRSPPEP